MNKGIFVITAVSAFVLCACDSSDKPQTGQVSIAISDAPMSGVNEVGMVLDQLVVRNKKGEQLKFDLQNKEFNLLQYRGMESNRVLNQVELKVGQYTDAHITVKQGDGNQGAYVDNGLGRHGLEVEAGQLPLRDFQVKGGQHLQMTMEVNLHQALTQTQDRFQLRHRGMWSVDNAEMGHLRGDVDAQWIADCETDYAASETDGEFGHLAYLYPAEVTEISQMSDIAPEALEAYTLPISVGPVFQDQQGMWHFTMGYLPAGNYRVGYTCLGHLDDPEVDDISTGDFSMFKDAGEVVVEAGTHGGHLNKMDCQG
ncbi:DUF4382 domain-containing protein [Shewanella gelidii]|uniref:DUF4382 domain-containing protein n=1 Tax=Shewanella gelidii TaxID=1642821 RepID=A0A917JJV3_9GAMM|nr:DUF4382 domain-containing protein [Shewanella gelidii]MCL1097046.1 DUF4382 domain-containing protein [Shewanella gelidii]GGI72132.1 hypothetical protein GCM10009332_06930 [Shewanella gelidii]